MQDISKKSKEETSFLDSVKINVYEFASVIITAIVAISIIFTFVFRIVGVVGTSMVPTLQDSDWLWVSAFNFKPRAGQVVIVTQPNWFDEPIVKRIIATENQTVDINFTTGDVYVDGVLLDEPYINNRTINNEGVQFPVTVPEDHVFVMGDNRQGSTDSRSDKIGFIREEYILGEVIFKLYNLEKDDFTGKVKMNFYSPSEWKVD